MDFQTKKFWVMVGLCVIQAVAIFGNYTPFETGFTRIMTIAAVWGGLDVGAGFTKAIVKKKG